MATRLPSEPPVTIPKSELNFEEQEILKGIENGATTKDFWIGFDSNQCMYFAEIQLGGTLRQASGLTRAACLAKLAKVSGPRFLNTESD